ncbi:Phosphoribosyl-AMP cyclohydrolase [archaeon HR04]|nr:Phosphoribosyl-AMP cyclohydrolase [archaeon HR04]
MKGEESGNVQYVKDVLVDCDSDALIYLVESGGPACHTGNRTCFHNRLIR